jgi:glycosyltransferase involved in cell wall biosynthesis
MRIAFLCFFEAYPPASGAAYVTYNCALLTPCTTLLVQLAERATVEHVQDLTIVSLSQRASSRLKKMVCMPLSIAKMHSEVSRFKPDYVVLEGASWAVYLLFLALVLRHFLPGVKVLYHAHNIEYLLRQERNGPIVAALTRMAEGHLLATCDRSYAVSLEDCQRLLSLYGVLPALLPNGVDCSANRTTPEEIDLIRKRYGMTNESILFMGLYAYPPNTEAVRFLVEKVMPWLHAKRPNVRLVVTGGGPPCSPPWLINTGVISRRDLDAVLCACRAGVAPIFKGSGTRLKILEYMAAGLPVVTTRKGAEGLNLHADRHVLFAETAAEFQEAILRLFCDPSLSESLSTQGASLVRSNFDWISLLRQFAKELEEL